MDDRNMLEDVLTTLKGQAGLFNHGTIESSTAGVHNTFYEALGKSLQQQNEVYNAMAEMGWYPMEAAPAKQVDKVRTKYSSFC